MTTRQEQLEWEAGRRNLGALSAMAAGLLVLLGGVVGAAIAGEGADNKIAQLLIADRDGLALVGVALLQALGYLALILPLQYLLSATRARRPAVPAAAKPLVLFGPLIYALAFLGQRIAFGVEASNFAGGPPTYEAANAAFEAQTLFITALIGYAGQLAVGAALVLVCLNAMRAGLLTRFMGILGIISGIATVIPIASPLPIIQTFWLIALGYLISGRWPQGVPKAWTSGKAEPWPSMQEMREQREAELERRRAERDAAREQEEDEDDEPVEAPSLEKETEPEPEPVSTTKGAAREHPKVDRRTYPASRQRSDGARKRKRKRRR